MSEIRTPNVSRSYGSWIFNYLCIQCLTPLKLWVLIPLLVRYTRTTSCDKVCQWLVAGRWFSLGTPVSSANKTKQPRYNWNIVESGVKHHSSTLLITAKDMMSISATQWRIVLDTTLCDYNFMWLQLYVIITLCDYNFMWLQLYVIITLCDYNFMWL